MWTCLHEFISEDLRSKQQQHKSTSANSTWQLYCLMGLFLWNVLYLGNVNTNKDMWRWDWVINKYYNWWWIGGIHSFLYGEHPVCSPLCIRMRCREALANWRFSQGMSGMQVHECLNNSRRSGLLTHCPVKKMKVGQRERATNLSLSRAEVKVLSQLNWRLIVLVEVWVGEMEKQWY